MQVKPDGKIIMWYKPGCILPTEGIILSGISFPTGDNNRMPFPLISGIGYNRDGEEGSITVRNGVCFVEAIIRDDSQKGF